MRSRILIIIALLGIGISNLNAQEFDSHQSFYVQGRLLNNKPVFKIIPGDQAVWYLGMKHGYRISYATESDGEFGDFKVIESKLMPASNSDFQSANAKKDYTELMRKSIYEGDYTPKGKSMDDLKRASSNMGFIYFSYLLTSCYSPTLSEMSGLQFSFSDPMPEKMMVKVEILGNDAYTHMQIIHKSQLYSSTVSPNIEVTQGDKFMNILWNHSSNEMLFVAYQVERSLDNENFETVGLPYFYNSLSPDGKNGMISATDSIPKNYIKYWYRVRAFDAFGYLSEPIEAQVAQGRDITPPEHPLSIKVEQTSSTNVHITWEHQTCDDMAGFQVIGAHSVNEKYTLLHETFLPADSREFDYQMSDNVFTYYRVLAIDTARNASASDIGYLVVYDTVAPELPTNIVAVADTNRVVTITWTPSVSADIKAYRVFKSYGAKNGFIPITPIPVADTVYRDTINEQRLEKKVYYQIVALDQHYNHSQPSDTIVALIPDTIPPTKPLLHQVKLDDKNNASLAWFLSSSDDVAFYSVYRKSNKDSIFVRIDSSTVDSVFVDVEFNTLAINFAEYYVTATDSSGNESVFSNGKRVFQAKKVVANLLSVKSVNEEEGHVKILWDNLEDEDYGVLVYRSVNDKGFVLLDRVDDKAEYIDKRVRIGTKYKYKLGVIASNGKRYPLSAEYTVKLK